MVKGLKSLPKEFFCLIIGVQLATLLGTLVRSGGGGPPLEPASVYENRPYATSHQAAPEEVILSLDGPGTGTDWGTLLLVAVTMAAVCGMFYMWCNWPSSVEVLPDKSAALERAIKEITARREKVQYQFDNLSKSSNDW